MCSWFTCWIVVFAQLGQIHFFLFLITQFNRKIPINLAQKDIEFVKQHLDEWLTEVSLGKLLAAYEIELSKRMVPVEEAFKHQRELIQ